MVPPAPRFREKRRLNHGGFTLIELVVVIIVVGILAVVAIPRFNTKTFDTVGFYQEALSSVRYAQKEAVAKRRVVCVGLTANSVTVRFAKTAGSFTCDTELTSPRGEQNPLLPMGLSDNSGVKAVKLYCSKCEDLYNPKSSRHPSLPSG